MTNNTDRGLESGSEDYTDIIAAINAVVKMLEDRTPTAQRNRALGWMDTAAFTLAQGNATDVPVGAKPNLNRRTIERVNQTRGKCGGCTRTKE